MRPRILLALLVNLGVACGTVEVAASCDEDADCSSGVCYAMSSPGYCTAVCSTEGSTDECPAGSICKPIRGGAPRCLLICAEQAECPANSDCNSVAAAPQRACEPVR